MKYTAKEFEKDIRRIFTAANIKYIFSFSNGIGFGASKSHMDYFVQKLEEDRYNVGYLRSKVGMVKEIYDNYFKYVDSMYSLQIAELTHYIKEKKYNNYVKDTLRRIVKQQVATILSSARRGHIFYYPQERLPILFKDNKKLTKKQLFDLLVTQGKLNMDWFEKVYGPMGDEGGKISERVTLYKYGPWQIYLDINTKRSVDEVQRLLDNVTSELKKKGYGKLCYGKVLMVDDLGGWKLADYVIAKDYLRLGFKLLKKTNVQNQIISTIHELGHRNYFKFITKEQRSKSDEMYDAIQGVTKGLHPHIDDEVLYRKTGDVFKIVNTPKRRHVYQIRLVELGENSQFNQANISKQYEVKEKAMKNLFILKGEGKKYDSFIPRPYGLDNKLEFYAVLWETWFQNKLKDPAKTWFENLER
jgi:hypothetical protein